MSGSSGQTTNPRLLEQVAEWGDSLAWTEFFRTYDLWVRRWIGVYRLKDDQAEELNQRIWVELASRIRTFRYDPSQKFRGWLQRLIRFRALDLMRELKQDRTWSLGDELRHGTPLATVTSSAFDDAESDGEVSTRHLLLQELAEQAQQAVRARVAPESWQAFWLIAIENMSIRDTADFMGKSYAAVFRNHQRVGRMLADEGRRLLDRPIEMRLK